MKEVTIDNVKARIAQLETSEQIGGRLPIRHEFEMACLHRMLELEVICAALAAENAGLKAAHPQPFGEDMMRAIEAYEWHQDEVPETGMLDAFFILRDSIRVETPATEAIMAEVRAQGVEMFGQWLSDSADIFDKNSRHDWADQNRVSADKAGEFAEHLRKGVQS